MKPVVSNTTPLRYLIEIDAIHVLPFLFEKIVVPPVVIQELSHPRTPKKVREYMTSLPKRLVCPHLARMNFWKEGGVNGAKRSIAPDVFTTSPT